ncbi:MAG TPA: hypothetical protein VER37_00695 [Thermomicrobiales bacterium]|nr:hypothetical protein [Thermomicrobiales bacterium]
MDNSPRLPTVSLVVAAILAVLTAFLPTPAGEGAVFHLSEIQIGLAAIALTLAIFGAQGLIGVLLEGRQLVPGRVPPRLTDPLTVAILLLVVLLLATAWWLGSSLLGGGGIVQVGVAAGLGCVALALLLVVYKEAFVGDEAHFDRRDDGVPW